MSIEEQMLEFFDGACQNLSKQLKEALESNERLRAVNLDLHLEICSDKREIERLNAIIAQLTVPVTT